MDEANSSTANNAMDWVCKRCQHLSTSKCNLIKHLRRKTPCQDVNNVISIEAYITELTKKEYNDKTYDCRFCGTKFNNYQNRHRHYKSCKKAPTAPQNNQHQLEKNVSSDEPKPTYEQLDTKAILQRLTHLEERNTYLEQRITRLEQVIKGNPQEAPNNTKKNKIKPRVKQACWERFVGASTTTKCFCCRVTEITFTNFNCGHIVAHANGGTPNLDNLRPICAPCNGAMGRTNMRDFAKEHFNVDIDV
jgi:hypothetical protein